MSQTLKRKAWRRKLRGELKGQTDELSRIAAKSMFTSLNGKPCLWYLKDKTKTNPLFWVNFVFNNRVPKMGQFTHADKPFDTLGFS